MFPRIDPSSYIDRRAVIIGDVIIDADCGIWPNAVLRGDLNTIHVMEGSNVQDNCVIHVTNEHDTIIGRNVSVGHGAIIHGARVGDNTIIGMNATVLDGAVIGSGCVIGANALVRSGMDVPDNSLVLGVPAKIVRQDPDLQNMTWRNAEVYHRLRDEHLKGFHVSWDELRLSILPIDELKSHEEIRESLLKDLIDAIRSDGEIRRPILVENKHHVVLDGHHRLEALRALGAKEIPCYIVNYRDERIVLDFWPEAQVRGFGKEDVVRTALSGRLYPPKTTRHIVKIHLDDYPVSLENLM